MRVARSLVDYVFRWLSKKFVDADNQQKLGILSPEGGPASSAAYTPARPLTASGPPRRLAVDETPAR